MRRMAREGAGDARPASGRHPGRCTAAERKARRAWARASADRAILKLSGEVDRLNGLLRAAEAALDVVVGDAEVSQRLRALLPALLAMLRGVPPTWLERLRRNVALHADASGIDVAAAGAAVLRQALSGPRLEARRGDVGRGADGLSADAVEFVPRGVCDMDYGDEELEYQFDAGLAMVPSVWPGLWEACEPPLLVHDTCSDSVEIASPSALEEVGCRGSASVRVLGSAPGTWEPLVNSPRAWAMRSPS